VLRGHCSLCLRGGAPELHSSTTCCGTAVGQSKKRLRDLVVAFIRRSHVPLVCSMLQKARRQLIRPTGHTSRHAADPIDAPPPRQRSAGAWWYPLEQSKGCGARTSGQRAVRPSQRPPTLSTTRRSPRIPAWASKSKTSSGATGGSSVVIAPSRAGVSPSRSRRSADDHAGDAEANGRVAHRFPPVVW